MDEIRDGMRLRREREAYQQTVVDERRAAEREARIKAMTFAKKVAGELRHLEIPMDHTVKKMESVPRRSRTMLGRERIRYDHLEVEIAVGWHVFSLIASPDPDFAHDKGSSESILLTPDGELWYVARNRSDKRPVRMAPDSPFDVTTELQNHVAWSMACGFVVRHATRGFWNLLKRHNIDFETL